MRPSPQALPHLAAGKSAGEDDLIIQRRYRIARRLTPLSGRVLLDFGCGNGAQTLLFAPHFAVTVGVDVHHTPLQQFATNANERGPGVFAVHYDGDRLPLRAGSVDYAISFEVLEHVRDEREALAELGRVIRPGGILVMSVPNRWWVFETHGADLPLLAWNRVPFFSWLPKRLHDRYARARIYGRREIVRKIERSGFTIVRHTYVTAPMDVVVWPALQRALRRTVFRTDCTRVPFLATATLVVATRNAR